MRNRLEERRLVNLCILSDAYGGEYEEADCEHPVECPLQLTEASARECPCKQRTYVGRVGGDRFRKPVRNDPVTVLACTFPNLRNGEPIRDAAAVANWARAQVGERPPLDEVDALMDGEEVAEFLGVSAGAIRQLEKDGALPRGVAQPGLGKCWWESDVYGLWNRLHPDEEPWQSVREPNWRPALSHN